MILRSFLCLPEFITNLRKAGKELRILFQERMPQDTSEDINDYQDAEALREHLLSMFTWDPVSRRYLLSPSLQYFAKETRSFIEHNKTLKNKEKRIEELTRGWVNFFNLQIWRADRYKIANLEILLNLRKDFFKFLGSNQFPVEELEKDWKKKKEYLKLVDEFSQDSSQITASFENGRIQAMLQAINKSCNSLRETGGVVIIVSLNVFHLQRLHAHLSLEGVKNETGNGQISEVV